MGPLIVKESFQGYGSDTDSSSSGSSVPTPAKIMPPATPIGPSNGNPDPECYIKAY